MTNLETGAICYEIAKVDASISTFYLVHNAIGQNVIDALGDDEQRERILKETINMDKICSFGSMPIRCVQLWGSQNPEPHYHIDLIFSPRGCKLSSSDYSL